VTYRNLTLAATIISPDHPAWQWLAKRSGRIAGLSLELRLRPELAGDDDSFEVDTDDDDTYVEATQNIAQVLDWMQPLQYTDSLWHPWSSAERRLGWGNI
jgi:hypothetical protein